MSVTELFEAKIAAPPDASGAVMVLVDEWDGSTVRHGPCIGWAHRPDGRQPQRNDRALIAGDGKPGSTWIVAWEPAP